MTASNKSTGPAPTPPDDPLAENSDVSESEDDLRALDPSLLGQAVVFGTDWTAATLIDQLRRGNVRLDPIFQRRDAWDPKRKSRFIESIVLGLPIPQIVLAEAKDEKGAFLVIDGKQRLLSLEQFAGTHATAPLVLAGLKFRKELNGKTYEDLQNDTRLAGGPAYCLAGAPSELRLLGWGLSLELNYPSSAQTKPLVRKVTKDQLPRPLLS